MAKTADSAIVITSIDRVEAWSKNPRSIEKKDFERLKKHLKKYGQYKPLICYRENGKYVTLGGNMRLKAMRDLGMRQIRVLEVKPKSEQEKIELSLIDNDRAGYYEDQTLAELIYPFKDDFDLDNFKVDLRVPDMDLGKVIDRFATIKKNLQKDNLDRNKKLQDIKILNLYAGIGGNRKFWGDLNITAVEWNEEIAKVYKDYFPNDHLIIDDAHKYLEQHFMEYDFIWSSPPCPTHSRLRKNYGNHKPIYPDMRLYEEILFLDGYFEGLYIIENVKSWYDPLIQPQELGRHYFWTNFNIPIIDVPGEIGRIDRFNKSRHQRKFDIDISKYHFSSDYPADKILRNMVHPKLGEYILKCAYPNEKAKKIE